MRKRVKKIIATLVLTALFVTNQGVNNVYAADLQNTKTTKNGLMPCTNLRWDSQNPGHILFDIPDNAGGYYEIKMIRRGSYSGDTYSYSPVTEIKKGGTLEYDFSDSITNNGDYSFEVTRYTKQQRDKYVSFEEGTVAICSKPFNYKRPATELSAPTNIRWNNKKNRTVSWDPVPNAKAYEYILSTGTEWGGFSSVTTSTSLNISDLIGDDKDVSFVVRAISDNILINANSCFSDLSVCDYTSMIKKVRKIVDKSLIELNQNKDVRLDIWKYNFADTLFAYERDDSIRKDIDTMESLFASKYNVTTNVKVRPDDGIDASKVKIRFGAFDARTKNSVVSLYLYKSVDDGQVPLTTAKYTKGERYHFYGEPSNYNGEYYSSHMIEITMPVPKGIDPSKSIVINYNPYFYSNASYHYINPKVNANGTITFMIENTPEFVVAEKNDGNSTEKADTVATPVNKETHEQTVQSTIPAEVINVDYDKSSFSSKILETIAGQNKVLVITTKEGVVFTVEGMKVDPNSVGDISFDTANDQDNNLVIQIRNTATEIKTPITIFALAQSGSTTQTLYFVNPDGALQEFRTSEVYPNGYCVFEVPFVNADYVVK